MPKRKQEYMTAENGQLMERYVGDDIWLVSAGKTK